MTAKAKAANMIHKAEDFAVRVSRAAVNGVIDLAKGLYYHAETVGILVLASLGLNAILAEIPFYVALPAFIEGPLLIPALACVGIYFLAWLSERRSGIELEEA